MASSTSSPSGGIAGGWSRRRFAARYIRLSSCPPPTFGETEREGPGDPTQTRPLESSLGSPARSRGSCRVPRGPPVHWWRHGTSRGCRTDSRAPWRRSRTRHSPLATRRDGDAVRAIGIHQRHPNGDRAFDRGSRRPESHHGDLVHGLRAHDHTPGHRRFLTCPSMSAVLKASISRPCTRRSPRSSPECRRRSPLCCPHHRPPEEFCAGASLR